MLPEFHKPAPPWRVEHSSRVGYGRASVAKVLTVHQTSHSSPNTDIVMMTKLSRRGPNFLMATSKRAAQTNVIVNAVDSSLSLLPIGVMSCMGPRAGAPNNMAKAWATPVERRDPGYTVSSNASIPLRFSHKVPAAKTTATNPALPNAMIFGRHFPLKAMIRATLGQPESAGRAPMTTGCKSLADSAMRMPATMDWQDRQRTFLHHEAAVCGK